MIHGIAETQLQQRFLSFPPDLREAITSVEVANVLLATAVEHKLTELKIQHLAEETGLIMGGVVQAKQFVPDLVGTLSPSEDEVRAIAKNVADRAFLPIRALLERMQGKQWYEDMTG